MDDATAQKLTTVVDTMRDAGMSSAEISDNLKQMGVSPADIDGILGAEPAPDLAAEPVPPLADDSLQPALDRQEEHLERLHATVGELHEKHDELAVVLADLDALKKEVEELRLAIGEIKPLVSALQRQNNNLIDINKKMLGKLAVR